MRRITAKADDEKTIDPRLIKSKSSAAVKRNFTEQRFVRILPTGTFFTSNGKHLNKKCLKILFGSFEALSFYLTLGVFDVR